MSSDQVFDIGMYNGLDTEYYLEQGFTVVAVEANPTMVERARLQFRQPIADGRLSLIHAAMNVDGKPVQLNLSGDDIGSSSVLADRVSHIQPVGTVEVAGLTLSQLIRDHGVPYFLKVDIEGSDRHCILPLTRDDSPPFVSFEIGVDFDELLDHLVHIGFDQFKIIDQSNFRSLEHVQTLSDRVALRLVRLLGYSKPQAIRRCGRFFSIGSSGPMPWLSDGRWQTSAEIRDLWVVNSDAGRTPNWYDLQARRVHSHSLMAR